MFNLTQLAPIVVVVFAFLGGFFLSYLTKQDPPPVDVSKYELKNQVQKLEYENKIKDLQTRELQRLRFIETADSTEIDSLWLNYGFEL